MPLANVSVRFNPERLKAHTKNEALMNIALDGTAGEKTYWCECDITVEPPLSLAHDKELNNGRTRIGLLVPGKRLEKQVRIYTRPNNFPSDYSVNLTVYVYDDDGSIAERIAQQEPILCTD